MNNKGFAITTILYGTLILFSLLLVSMLGILSTYRENLEKLVENTNGARDIVTMNKPKEEDYVDSFDNITKRGLYCMKETNPVVCQYVSGS